MLLAFEVSVPVPVFNMLLAGHTECVVHDAFHLFWNHGAGIGSVLASLVGMAATAKVGVPTRVTADTSSTKWAVKNLGFASYLVKVFLRLTVVIHFPPRSTHEYTEFTCENGVGVCTRRGA